MSEFVNTIELLGDQETAYAIISKTITEFRDNVLTEIAGRRFYECKSLTTVDLPNVTKLGDSAFNYCNSLSSVNVPNVESVGGNSFANCIGLTSIVLPKVVSLPSYVLSGCTNLKFVDLPVVSSIASWALANSSKLKTLILRSSALCTLGGTDAFYRSSPFTVYVPYDFIDAYENATNWSSLVSQGKVTFEALEGSGYD